MTIDDVRKRLAQACQNSGSQALWAKDNGLSTAYVNDVLHGRREPGGKLLAALGLERVVLYREQHRRETEIK